MRAMAKKKHKTPSNIIAQNKKARHDYHLTDKFEAGIALTGWEVKSLRAGKVDIVDAFVFMQNGEALLVGAQISPLPTASTHFVPEPHRTLKLLLHTKEVAEILDATQQKGQTCVCTALYWKNHLVKAELALAKGKQAHDKRDADKDKDWARQKQRIVRDAVKQ